MAARHQHRNDHRYFLDGLSHPTRPDKDALAIQLKLNEIVACLQGASNRLIDIKGLRERELETLHRHYQQLSALWKQQHDLFSSHSVDEAERRHLKKIESDT